MTIFVVKVPVFGNDIVVCFDCSAKDANNAVYDLNGLRTVVEFLDGRGCCVVPSGANEIYMWVKNPQENASTVFHELVHVALGICDQRGMARDDELLAYLVGWLKQEVADRIFWRDGSEPC